MSPASPSAGKVIDVHAHAVLPPWRMALERLQGVSPGQATIAGHALPAWSPEGHLAFMDRQGITASVLSWPEGVTLLSGAAARALARAMNEALAGIVASHPKRLGAFAVVPLDDMDATLEETAYALDVLNLDGVACLASPGGEYLGAERFAPWFEEMSRRGCTLFMHPGPPPGFEQVYVGPNVSTLEFMFDTTRAVTRLVLSGFRSRFPGVSIIAPHGGGTIPYLAHRIAISTVNFGAGPGRPPMTAAEVMAQLAGFHFDLTASTSAPQLAAIAELVPTSQLLLGFDYPLMPEPLAAPALAAFDGFAHFDEDDRALIRAGNARRLLPRLAARLEC